VTIHGRCHCGALGFEFDSAIAPQQLGLRRCGCSFCRKHGARTTSDPAGAVRFVLARPAALRRYRFATRSADFLLCAECGTYLAAIIEHPGHAWATLNANCFELDAPLLQEAPLVHYEAETPGQRHARRMAKWTPVQGTIPPI
jgi:hypothetical protein